MTTPTPKPPILYRWCTRCKKVSHPNRTQCYYCKRTFTEDDDVRATTEHP